MKTTQGLSLTAYEEHFDYIYIRTATEIYEHISQAKHEIRTLKKCHGVVSFGIFVIGKSSMSMGK